MNLVTALFKLYIQKCCSMPKSCHSHSQMKICKTSEIGAHDQTYLYWGYMYSSQYLWLTNSNSNPSIPLIKKPQQPAQWHLCDVSTYCKLHISACYQDIMNGFCNLNCKVCPLDKLRLLPNILFSTLIYNTKSWFYKHKM